MTLAKLARWCYRHRRRVVLLWIAGFVVFNGLGGAIGSAYSDNFSGSHSDSIAAFDLLKTRFPARAGDTADIVFATDKGVDTSEVRAAVDGLLAQVGPGKVAHVVAAESPFDRPGRISFDGHVAYATVTFG